MLGKTKNAINLAPCAIKKMRYAVCIQQHYAKRPTVVHCNPADN